MYDVIIIGAGPAGISASLYTKRANLNTLILYNDKSGLEKAEKIENYYGFENGIQGKELYDIGIKQAQNIGVDVKEEEVIKIENNFEDNSKKFNIVTTKNTYQSAVLILATGNKKNTPNIKGIEKFEGKGVSYCAICDGFFYKNRDISVIGSGNYARSETSELRNLANKITTLTNGQKAPEFRADNVTIDTKKIDEIIGENRVEEIKFSDGTKMKTEGIFVAQGVARKCRICKKVRSNY